MPYDIVLRVYDLYRENSRFRDWVSRSIASCHIVNVRYHSYLLVTEIRVANSAVRVRVVNSAVRVRFSSENYGILKDCWMKLLLCCTVCMCHDVAAPEFFCGGIEGAKCISERAEIKKITKNGWEGRNQKNYQKLLILTIFSFWLGASGGGEEPLTGGGKCPHAPLDAATGRRYECVGVNRPNGEVLFWSIH